MADSGDINNSARYGVKYGLLGTLTEQLHGITYRMRILGVMILFVSLANVAVLVGGVISGISIRQYNQINSFNIANNGLPAEYFSSLWLIANLAIFVVALVMLGLSDVMRRRGDSLFQEVSNLFQELGVNPVDTSGEVVKVSVGARFELRSFSSAADLPLIRGRFGAGVYAAVNFVVVIVAVILYTQFA